ncbi:hypothetical protein KY285_030565 [Solanum tuberosum]|nr:hypothetical protein KY285_030565 [Solanum tuberosum]
MNLSAKINYMCLTAHFIDRDWVLHKRILNFCPITSHKGEHLTKYISNCILDWNLDNVFTVTVDNASSNDVAVLELSKKLDMWGTNMMDDGSIAGSIQNEDWANVRNVTKFLENFYELTLKVSGSRDDVDLSKMASGMKEKFKKYWGTPEKMNKMLFIASVLDPRNKFVYLARDALAIPMSSVASECAFSTGGRILDPFRSSLTPNVCNALFVSKIGLDKKLSLFVLKKVWSFLKKLNLN